MKTTTKNFLMTFMIIGLVFSSCSTEEDSSIVGESQMKEAPSKTSKEMLLKNAKIPNRITWEKSKIFVEDFGIKNSLLNAVEPSECGPTPFREVLTYYNDLLIDGFISVWDGNPDAIGIILNDYFIINQIAAIDENKNADSFGVNGKYTAYVNNRVRSLEKFWDMAGLIQVRGQHSSTLEDLDFLRLVYENYSSAPPEVIDYIIAIAEHFNNASDQIPENPFYASDGFATFSGYIVIGDGIVDMLAEVGLDPKVVWSSILAHEWAHQIQFKNYGIFAYPVPPFIGTPESTRMTELEADFITGYYLTHKRGGTYNWKRIEDVLQAFFEIGDCGFGSSGHHGTPIQRMEAAHQGFLLAQSEQKKGKISPADVVHEAFIENLDGIIEGGE